MQKVFRESEFFFPRVRDKFGGPEEIFDKLMKEKIISDLARRGCGPGATYHEIKAYLRWVKRVAEGSSGEAPASAFQKKIHAIDMWYMVEQFYKKLNERLEDS
jgi:hypothetical protein